MEGARDKYGHFSAELGQDGQKKALPGRVCQEGNTSPKATSLSYKKSKPLVAPEQATFWLLQCAPSGIVSKQK